MNQAFKLVNDANNQNNALNNYETSVLFITKRYNQSQASPTKQIIMLHEKQQKLFEEIDALKVENKKLATQIDDMKKDIDIATVARTSKSSSNGKKSNCSIM